MTSIALLAVLLAAGWYFYRQWRYTRFEALHHSGHPQYFGAALCAVYLFSLSAPIHALALESSTYAASIQKLQHMLPLQVGERQDPDSLALHFALTFISLLLAASLPLLFNAPLIRTRSLAQLVAMKHGAIDQIENLAIKCEAEGTLSGITLDSGKFYAGILEEFTAPRAGKEWVAMTPVASGYRDECGGLQLTTFYDIQLSGNMSSEIFRVVISTRQIVSAQSFDLALYQKFQTPVFELAGIKGLSEVDEAHADSRLGRSSKTQELDANESDSGKRRWRKRVRRCLRSAACRYFLYLGLPFFLLVSAYVGMWSVVAGLIFVVLAGVCAMASEIL